MSLTPWTDPDPKPGCFDAELSKLAPGYVEAREGDPHARLRVPVGVEGEDARRRERISQARGKAAADVVSDLLRDAEHSHA